MIAGVVACAVTLLVMYPLVTCLRRLHLVDIPNARSSHTTVTPRGGGVGVMLGVVAGGAVSVGLEDLGITLRVAVAVCLAVLVAAVGLVDDLRTLRAHTRLVAQILAGAAAAIAVLAGAHLNHWWLLALPVAVAWQVAFVNAFNFMDGIDGISGITGAVAGAWFGYLGVETGDHALAVVGAVLAGASLGFLPWNLFQAKVFLGDVGSYGVGCLIAFLVLWVTVEHEQPLWALAPTTLYLADTGATLVRRWRAGASLTTAHREHAYQRVTQRGWSHSLVSLTIGALTGVCCVLVSVLPVALAGVGIVLLMCLYLTAPSWLPQPKSRAS